MAVKLTPYWFTPEGQDDLPESKRARFRLRPLSERQLLELLDTCRIVATNEVPVMIPTNKTWGEAFALGVIEWENVIDHDAAPLKYPRDVGNVPWLLQLQVGTELYFKARHLNVTVGEDGGVKVEETGTKNS